MQNISLHIAQYIFNIFKIYILRSEIKMKKKIKKKISKIDFNSGLSNLRVRTELKNKLKKYCKKNDITIFEIVEKLLLILLEEKSK